MARVRSSGGNTGSIWGLVIFGAGFFICLILAILFYTKVDGAKQALQDANAQAAKVMTSAESNNGIITELKADGEPGTVVGKLLKQQESLQQTINGLQGEIQTTKGKLSEAENGLKGQEGATASAQADLQKALADKAAMEAELTAQVKALSTDIAAIGTGVEDLDNTSKQQVQELVKAFAAERTKFQTAMSEMQLQVDEHAGTISDLELALETAIGARDPLAAPVVTLPDARVVGYLADQNKLYLDIGRDSNLRLGMAFAVYDHDELVKVQGNDLAPGKAIVEVISMESNAAVARVISSKPRVTIGEGDVLVNVVFDPNRVHRFHVFGQFDLNFDGKVTPQGKEAVEAMVTRFGGKVDKELAFSTDYVVLGMEPDFPAQPVDTGDLIAMKNYREALANFQAYQDRAGQARELGVPILTQNRFVDLVGYFER